MLFMVIEVFVMFVVIIIFRVLCGGGLKISICFVCGRLLYIGRILRYCEFFGKVLVFLINNEIVDFILF